jgi:hypothetical protein
MGKGLQSFLMLFNSKNEILLEKEKDRYFENLQTYREKEVVNFEDEAISHRFEFWRKYWFVL